ncbi:MAG: zf-HC2 domain-containing protein, partial [Pseudoflavonifractor sp.]
MKSCEDYFELISARLDGALSPEDTAALDAHLAVCPECRLLAADLAELHSALPTLSAAPPADLIPNVMARIHAENAKVLPFPAPAKRGLHRRAFGSIAAVLAVVVLGASLSHFGAPSAPAPILAVNPTQESGAPAARNLPAPEASPEPEVSPEPTPAVTVPVQALPQGPAAPPAPVENTAPVPVESAAPVPVENTAPVPVQAPQQSNQENAGPLLN